MLKAEVTLYVDDFKCHKTFLEVLKEMGIQSDVEISQVTFLVITNSITHYSRGGGKID